MYLTCTLRPVDLIHVLVQPGVIISACIFLLCLLLDTFGILQQIKALERKIRLVPEVYLSVIKCMYKIGSRFSYFENVPILFRCKV